MEKYKKASELDKTLRTGEKLVKILLKGLVASRLCKQETSIKRPHKCYLVAKKYAFEIFENLADSVRRKLVETGIL